MPYFLKTIKICIFYYIITVGWVGFYLILFGLIFGHINHCRLFNARSGLYVYIRFIRIIQILLCITSNSIKHQSLVYTQFYFQQFSLAQANKAKWHQVSQCTTKNSIRHQLFVYTQVKDQTVLFQTIQFSTSLLFAYSLNAKQLDLTYR